MNVKRPVYVAGFERGVRPIGDWSIWITLSICSIPSIDAVRARLVGRAVQLARQRAIEDLVDQRRLARAADAGDGDQHAERNLDVDVLEVVLARAFDDDRCRAWPDAGARGVSIDSSPLRYAPVSDPLPSFSSSAGVPWKISWPPCSPAPGTEIDHVVRACGSSPRRARRRRRYCRGRAGARASSSSARLSRWCRPIDGSSRT